MDVVTKQGEGGIVYTVVGTSWPANRTGRRSSEGMMIDDANDRRLARTRPSEEDAEALKERIEKENLDDVLADLFQRTPT